jgi:hypothetical protein
MGFLIDKVAVRWVFLGVLRVFSCQYHPTDAHIYIYQSDLFYLLIIGVESYCCTWSYSMTHTYTRQDSPGRGIGPSQKRLFVQHTTLTRGKYLYLAGIRTSNPSKRAATDLCLRPRGHRDRPHICSYKLLQNENHVFTSIIFTWKISRLYLIFDVHFDYMFRLVISHYQVSYRQ